MMGSLIDALRGLAESDCEPSRDDIPGYLKKYGWQKLVRDVQLPPEFMEEWAEHINWLDAALFQISFTVNLGKKFSREIEYFERKNTFPEKKIGYLDFSNNNAEQIRNHIFKKVKEVSKFQYDSNTKISKAKTKIIFTGTKGRTIYLNAFSKFKNKPLRTERHRDRIFLSFNVNKNIEVNSIILVDDFINLPIFRIFL